MNPRVEIASILCRSLDEAKFPWAITHGAEGYPSVVGRDLDILLPFSSHSQAVTQVMNVAKEHGWSSYLIPLTWAGAPVLLWKHTVDTLHCFEMHFIDRIDWSGCILADSSEIIPFREKINGLWISTWPAFAKRVLIQILAGCWNRIEERPDDFVIHPHEEQHLTKPLSRLFGQKTSYQLSELIKNRDITAIRSLAPSLRSKLILRTFMPYSATRISWSWFTGKISRSLGIAPSRLPFLILTCSEENNLSDWLVKIESNLGFTKCLTLSSQAPSSIIGKHKEKRKIHLHRSLFRLVILPLSRLHSTESIAKRVYITKYSHNDLFNVKISNSTTSEKVIEVTINGTTISLDPNTNTEPIASLISYHYLENLTYSKHP